MKRKNPISFFLFFSLFILSGCDTTGGSQTASSLSNELSIVLSTDVLDNSYKFIKNFADCNKNYKLNVTVLSSNELSYQLRHDLLDYDLIISNSCSDLNASKDHLYDFSNTETLAKYSGYIQSFLSASDGGIYSLPSPGLVYSYCVNLDLLNEYNLTCPKNQNELLDFAEKAKEYATPYVSAFADSEAYLNNFMQESVAPFLSTTTGNDFFEKYQSGTEKMFNNENLFNFVSTTENFYSLYSSGFFSAERNNAEDIDKFFNGEAFLMAVDPSQDFETLYKEHSASFDYEFIPFLGSSDWSSCVCTTSEFYLSIFKNHYTKEKEKIINAFIDSYSSTQGQSLLLDKQSSCSYLKASSNDYGEKGKKIQNCFTSGKVYLTDAFESVFSYSVSSLRDYATGNLSTSALIDDFDTNMESALEYKSHRFELSFIDEKGHYDEGYTLRKLADILKKKTNSEILVLNSSFLKMPILDTYLFEDELSSAFDSSFSLVPVTFYGKDVKTIIDFIQETQKEEEKKSIAQYPSSENLIIQKKTMDDASVFELYGAYKKNEKYYLSNNQELKDDEIYSGLIPNVFIRSGDVEPIKKGNAILCYDVLKEYFSENR